MEKTMVFGLVIAAILLFGCIGDGNKATNTGSNNVNAINSQNQNTKPQESGNNQPTGSTRFNPSLPQKCTIKDRVTDYVSTYYFDGKGNIRIEINVANQKVVTIVRDNVVYMQPFAEMKQSPILQNCDWLYISADDKDSSNVATPSAKDIQKMMEAASRYEISCIPQNVDSALFTTHGKVCDLKKMMNEAAKNPCASITDINERAECEKSMAGYQ